jgi:fructose-bisphosphate aldolase class 1
MVPDGMNIYYDHGLRQMYRHARFLSGQRSDARAFVKLETNIGCRDNPEAMSPCSGRASAPNVLAQWHSKTKIRLRHISVVEVFVCC